MKEKELKVYYNSFDKPQIILQGEWIREIGFNIGDNISVIYDKDFLIITPIEKIALTKEALGDFQKVNDIM